MVSPGCKNLLLLRMDGPIEDGIDEYYSVFWHALADFMTVLIPTLVSKIHVHVGEEEFAFLI